MIYLALEPNNGGILLDLSLKGMRISVARPLNTGTQMTFSFGETSVQQVRGIGRVAWIDPSKKSAGIFFVDLSEGSSGKINELLTSAPVKAGAEPFPEAQAINPSPDRHTTNTQSIATDQPETGTLSFESFQSIALPSCVTVDPYARPNGAGADLDNTPGLAPAKSISTPKVSHTLETRNAVADSTDPVKTDNDSPGMEPSESAAGLLYNDTVQRNRSPFPDDAITTHQEPAAQRPDLLTASTSEPPAAHCGPETQLCGVNEPLPIYTLPPTYPSPPSRLAVMGKVILPALQEIGWGMENDWHVTTGLVLIIAGFIALWQRPPLVLLAVALWIAGAFVLTGKKHPIHNADQ